MLDKTSANVYAAINQLSPCHQKQAYQLIDDFNHQAMLPAPDVSEQLKLELNFLKSIYDYQPVKGFFCELMRWTESHLLTIPIAQRLNDVNSKFLLNLQRMAIRSIFSPNDDDDVYISQLNTMVRESKTPLVYIHMGDNAFDYWEEFRYAGNTNVIDWLQLTDSPETFREYSRSHPFIDKHTYEFAGNADNFSRRTLFIDGKLCTANINNHEWEPIKNLSPCIYVLTNDHQLMIAPNTDQPRFYHHSYLQHGLPVICAGEMVIKDGMIAALNYRSGHYRPSIENFTVAVNILKKQGVISDRCIYLRTTPHIARFFLIDRDKDDFQLPADLEASFPSLESELKNLSAQTSPPGKAIAPPMWQINANKFIKEWLDTTHTPELTS